MPLQKLYTLDITASSYPTLAVTAERPTLGVIGATGPLPYIRLMAIMTDAANEAGEIEIVGWSQDSAGYWVPQLIGRATVTAGTFTGVSGALASATQFFADTYAVTEDVGYNDRCEVGSNGVDMPGGLMVNPIGFSVLQVRAKVATAASINVLWEQLDT
jgi:hypothetical protein